MKKLIIAGIGQGNIEYLPRNVLDIINESDHFVLQSGNIQMADYLKSQGKSCYILNDLISENQNNTEATAKSIIDICSKYGQTVLLPAGQGIVDFEEYCSISKACKERNVQLEIFPGTSLSDCALSALNKHGIFLDAKKVCSYFASELDELQFDTRYTNIFVGINSRDKACKLKSSLLTYYPFDFPVYVLGWSKKAIIEKIGLSEIDGMAEYLHNTCMVIEPVPFNELTTYDMNGFMHIIEILRSENGCPWDRAQTHESLRRSLIEECYEVLEAIELKDDEKICEELGDVMLIIVLHAQIAKENEKFTMLDIIDGISKKIVSRHTHVFAGVNATTLDEISENWEEIKKTEKHYICQTDILKSVPKQFPALIRSEKVQKKACKAGIKKSSQESYKELKKEIETLEKVSASDEKGNAFELIGEILANVANIAMLNKIDPEEALANATEKFIADFEKAEKSGQTKKLN